MTTKAKLLAIVARLEGEKASLFDLTCTQQTQIAVLTRDLNGVQAANRYTFDFTQELEAKLKECRLANSRLDLQVSSQQARIDYLVRRYVPQDQTDALPNQGDLDRA
jgi:hypothetical protein